jgi:hypothetical protein
MLGVSRDVTFPVFQVLVWNRYSSDQAPQCEMKRGSTTHLVGEISSHGPDIYKDTKP